MRSHGPDVIGSSGSGFSCDRASSARAERFCPALPTLRSSQFSERNRSWVLALIRVVQRRTVEPFADGPFDNPTGDNREVVRLAFRFLLGFLI